MRSHAEPHEPNLSSDSDNDPSRATARPAGLSWGDADLPAGAAGDRTSGSGERDVKGVFGVGAPPLPAGASLAGTPDVDPIASLFASDKTLPAPGINDAPSEAELGRWRATMQAPLLGERVIDPPAPAALRVVSPAPPVAPPRAAAPRQAAVTAVAPPQRIADFAEQPIAPQSPPRRMEAVDVELPPAPPPAAGKARGTRNTGKRRRAQVAPPEVDAVPEPQAPESVRPPPRRRIERGPSKSLLAGLGVASLLALVALGILLGVVPNPLSPPAAEIGAAGPSAPAAVAAQAPAPVAAGPAAQPTAAVVGAPPAPPAQAVGAQPAAAPPKGPTEVASAPAAARAPKAAVQAAAPAPSEAEPEESSDEHEPAGAPEALLRAGHKALAADDPQGAEAIARKALATAPQDHHAMEVLVLALMDQDRGKEALPFARKMVQRRSRRVPYRLLLGDVLLMVGDEAGARAEWQKALQLSPGDRQIKRRLGL